MVASVRERLHSVNAEKLAEINAAKHSAQYSAYNYALEHGLNLLAEYDDVNDAAFYTELPPNVAFDMYVGDSTDIFDADVDDIATWLAMFGAWFNHD